MTSPEVFISSMTLFLATQGAGLNCQVCMIPDDNTGQPRWRQATLSSPPETLPGLPPLPHHAETFNSASQCRKYLWRALYPFTWFFNHRNHTQSFSRPVLNTNIESFIFYHVILNFRTSIANRVRRLVWKDNTRPMSAEEQIVHRGDRMQCASQ